VAYNRATNRTRVRTKATSGLAVAPAEVEPCVGAPSVVVVKPLKYWKLIPLLVQVTPPSKETSTAEVAGKVLAKERGE